MKPADGYAAHISAMAKAINIVITKLARKPQIIATGPPAPRPKPKVIIIDARHATSVNPKAKFINEPRPLHQHECTGKGVSFVHKKK